jgi:hypothetical protein
MSATRAEQEPKTALRAAASRGRLLSASRPLREPVRAREHYTEESDNSCGEVQHAQHILSVGAVIAGGDPRMDDSDLSSPTEASS